jgi:hypothetical protein
MVKMAKVVGQRKIVGQDFKNKLPIRVKWLRFVIDKVKSCSDKSIS